MQRELSGKKRRSHFPRRLTKQRALGSVLRKLQGNPLLLKAERREQKMGWRDSEEQVQGLCAMFVGCMGGLKAANWQTWKWTVSKWDLVCAWPHLELSAWTSASSFTSEVLCVVRLEWMCVYIRGRLWAVAIWIYLNEETHPGDEKFSSREGCPWGGQDAFVPSLCVRAKMRKATCSSEVKRKPFS